MNTLAGKGISVVAPAGGAYSMYTNWEQDGSKQWDTFLSSELPNWLAANKGLAPGGHAAVGASQGGYAAMALAAFHPDRFGFAGSLSGFLYPSSTNYNGAILAGLQQFGGVDGNGMWGAPQLGRWKWHDPYVHASLLAQNNTRVWVFSPTNDGASDPAAMIGQAGAAMGSAREFYQQYRSVGGHNGHFDFPGGGDNGWGSWSGSWVRCRATSSAPSGSRGRKTGRARGRRTRRRAASRYRVERAAEGRDGRASLLQHRPTSASRRTWPGTSPRTTRRKRHRVLAWIAAVAMAGVVGLVIVAVVVLLRSPESPPSAVPPGVVPPTSTTTHPHKPRPASQDASLPRRAADQRSRHLGILPAGRPAQPDAVPECVAAQRDPADRPAVPVRPGCRCTPFPTPRSSTIR